jgi:hypothetical protein
MYRVLRFGVVSTREIAQCPRGDLALKRYPTFYVLLDAWQDLVVQREGEFDFRRYPSQLFPCVTSVHYCHIFSVPVSAVSPSISLKRISLSGLIFTHTMCFVFK